MSSEIQNLIHSTLADGARSTKFSVEISTLDSNKLTAFAKSTSLPTISRSVIEIKKYGRTIPIPGQVKYGQTWSCTFYLSPNHELRSQLMNELNNGKHGDIILYQHAFDSIVESESIGNALKSAPTGTSQQKFSAKYTLYNAFVTELGEVQYDAEGVGNILEFPVTFSYSHFKMESFNNIGNQGTVIDKYIQGMKDKLTSGLSGVRGSLSGGKLNPESKLANLNAEQTPQAYFTEINDGISGWWDDLWKEDTPKTNAVNDFRIA